MKDYIYERFPASFFEEETRCDYVISEDQKKLWAVELDMLNHLLDVCKKHDIQMFVYAGTMLGAVRHNGFIPWDDDMDFFLTRENYEKLRKVAPEEFKEPYFFQNARTDRQFFIGYSRLRNSDTTGILRWEKSLDYNNGIYLDLFVMDAFINDRKLVTKQRRKAKFLGKLMEHYYATTEHRNLGQRIILKLYQNTFCKLVPYDRLMEKYDQTLRMYEGKTDLYAMLTHNDSFDNWFSKEDVSETIWMDYENIKVPVPKNYDKMLKIQFGDYMKLPPVEERGFWHGDNITYDPDTPYKDYIREHQ
ncbi:MAG: LicD family protein [Erysipelotrichaceae bacterium]|nr:LicD family protein [Erysipelotrichaceae bacterium]